ncbi:MAG: CHAT domain-containing protein [Planctomycetes bacterium]|nr:CHAT domain-containing protein [Planctomycetota bacterium]
MASAGHGCRRRRGRFGIVRRFALTGTWAASTLGFACAGLAQTPTHPSPVVEIERGLESLRRGETMDADAAKAFVNAVLLAQRERELHGIPRPTLVEWLEAARDVTNGATAMTEPRAYVQGFLIRERADLGEGGRAVDEVEPRLREWIDAAPYCGPMLAASCADALRREQRLREAFAWLDLADERSRDSNVAALADTACSVAEVRCFLEQELGTPDRLRTWVATLRDRIAALGAGATRDRVRGLLRLEIASALASGSQRAALDACEAAANSAREWSDPELADFAELRAAIASRLDGQDPRRCLHEDIVERLERAAASTSRGTYERELAATELAETHLLAGELTPTREILTRHGLDPVDPGLRIRRLVVAARLARQDGTAEDDVRTTLSQLRSAIERRFEAFAQLPRTDDGDGPLYYAAIRNAVSAWITGHVERGGDPSEAFDLLVRAQAAGTLAQEFGATAPSIERIRDELLRPGEGLLLHVFAPAGNHVFAVDRDGIVHVQSSNSRVTLVELAALNECIRIRPDHDPGDAVRTDQTAVATSLGRRLGHELVPDALRARVRGWYAIAFSGADVLGAMPLEAMVLDEKLLCVSHAITVWPSIPVAWTLAHDPPRRAADAGAVVIAARSPAKELRALDARLVDLPVDDRRMRAWLQAFPGAGTLLVDDAATTSAVAALDASTAAVEVILAHGFVTPGLPRPAALALTASEADRGEFRCADVERTHAADVVFLATCSAGAGPRRAGDDGAQHLGGAFLRAGTRSVVLPTGPVDLDASLELLDAFIASVADGRSATEAMRAARARLVADPRFRHPYYFAQYRVYGRG